MATAKKPATPKNIKLKPVSSNDDVVIDGPTDTNAAKKPNNADFIKKKDIYEHVSVSTGLRKRDVREAVDSLLQYFHKCLAEGKTIQVPPLGKIKTIERGEGDDVKLHYKLVLKKPADTEKKPD